MKPEKIIKLAFENKTNCDIVSEIIDTDKAFLVSLLKLIGCKKYPNSLNIKLGVIKQKDND